MASGDGALGGDALTTLVPRLAIQLIADSPEATTVYRQVEGSLLSADISGFTRLSETLSDRGRQGTERITQVVNSCLSDLIEVGEYYGGDVLKFGGDAVLVFFDGPDHELRAAASAREMQYALRRNANARRHELLMTVGVSDGPFHAMVVGEHQRDILFCGAATTRTLQLEGAASAGEVVVAESMARSIAPPADHGGLVVHANRSVPIRPPPNVRSDAIAPLLTPSLLAHYRDYADHGAEHRRVACGFVSIDGVDEVIHHEGGDRAAAELTDLFTRIVNALDSTGVTLLHSDMEIGGVRLFICAGVPLSVDDPADALVHAALAIAALESPFAIRLGLNAGRVVAGFLGAPHRRTFTVMGDAVNTAARMLGKARSGDVIAVSTVGDRTRGIVDGTPLEPFMVKGKTHSIEATRVHGIRYDGDNLANQDRGFFGRDDEQRTLEGIVERQGSATIVGATGAGKTRLRTETVHGDGVIAGTGGRYLTATPYGPFWTPLRRMAGIDPAMSSKDAGRALASHLASTAPDLAAMASLLAPAFGAELAEGGEAAAIEPEFRRGVVHRLVVELFSRQQPSVSVIVLEDTQWLDDASRELLAHLQKAAATRGWAIIRTRRSEVGDPPPPNDPGTIQILLGPLPDSAIESIITETCPRPLDQDEFERLVRQAEGNPLFAIELAISATSPAAELPGTLEDLIVGRIDRLPAQHRRSVRLASVLGARFDHTQFAALVASSGDDVEPDLAKIDEIFVTDSDGTAEFRQLLYRDAAYASLPFGRRKRLHREVGEYVESTVDDVDAYASLLSEHFRLAEDRMRCWRYSVLAAERALRAHSPVDAELLYRRAVDFAPRGLSGQERSQAFQGLGECLMDTGSLEEAHQWFAKSRRVTQSEEVNLVLMGLQGICRERQGRYSDAMRTYSRLIAAAEGFPAARVAALNGRASVHYHQGKHADCRDEATEALRIAERTSLREEQVQAHKLLHIAAEALGDDRAEAHAESALAVARDVGALSAEAEILNNLGVSHHVAGELDQAAAAYRQSFELKDRVGDRAGSALVQMNLAEVDLDRGVIDGVPTMLRASMSEFEATGFTTGSAYSQGLLGRHALAVGRLTDSADLLADSVQIFEDLADVAYQAYFELFLLEARVKLGDASSAEQTLQRVRALLDQGAYDNPEATLTQIESLANDLNAIVDT